MTILDNIRHADQTARWCEHVQHAGGERFGKAEKLVSRGFRQLNAVNRLMTRRNLDGVKTGLWKPHLWTQLMIKELADSFNPILRDWINQYGRFYKSKLAPIFN
ncbi:hypothetical protein V466_00290 [Pseudomonas mandelii PD30]|uniref:Group II intron maturase-specific domain-containing protein n=1 Tax=Pseudomonas mandelii PD30 TaxID=1419583 RepID=A0A059LAB5_9PSED|nr:hypothetical protein V466_00290 [Pseudomonas mandelii PD30]